MMPHCRENMSWNGDAPLPYSASQELAQSLFPNIDTTSQFEQFDEKETYFLESLDEVPR